MKKHTIKLFDLKLILGIFLSFTMMEMHAQSTNTNNSTNTKSVSNSMRTISGVVIDAATGKPLVGIRVQAYSKPVYTTMTVEDGTFELKVPDYITALTANADGFGMIISAIDTKTSHVQFKLYSNKFSAAYRDKFLTTSDVSANVNNLNADVSIDKSIQTSVNANLRTITRSGQQGVGAVMLMNGLNSLVANAQPLIVIDGNIIDMQYNRPSSHDGFFNNLLANISVADIENVTVLQNGLSLYGAKGANGVLLIKTKRNKNNMATKIDLDLSAAYETMPTLTPMMDATDYRFYASELLGTTGTKLTEFKFLQSDPNYFYYTKYNNNTDWKKQVYRDAFTNIYGLNVQGGDEIAKYYMSVGFANAQSTIKKFDMNRFNIRLNSDIVLSNKSSVRIDASYSDVTRNMRDDGVTDDISTKTITSVGLLGLIKAPILSPYQFDLYGRKSHFLSDADDYLDEVLGEKASLANPASLLQYAEGNNKNTFGNRSINFNASPDYKINRYFTLRESVDFSMINTNSNYYTPLTGMPTLRIDEEMTVENIVKSLSSNNISLLSDTRLEYKWAKNEHTLNAIGGFRFLNSSYELTQNQGHNTGSDKTPQLNANLAYKSVSGVDDVNTSLDYYVNGDYNYKNLYFLNAGMSMEASSRFGQDVSSGLRLFGVPWGIFSSIQGSWLVTSEPWFKSNDILNLLKVNVSYDVSGNDDLDCTASRSYFSSVRILNNANGLMLSNIGNTRLQWETTNKLSGGFEANLFNNRLTFNAFAYKSTTNNLLSLKKLNYIGGIETLWSNDGALTNNGYNVSFMLKAINTSDIKVEVGASVAHYENKITKLPGNQQSYKTDYYGGTVISQLGMPVGLFYGYKTDGIYTRSIDANPTGDNSQSKYVIMKNGTKNYFGAGDVNFVTTDNLEVNEDDRTIIGNPNPDFYGNIFANAAYKDFSLKAVFNYSKGNDIYNYQRMVLESGSNFYNQSLAMNNRWTTEGQETDLPVITYGDPKGNSRFSDRWIEDGSYLRLKTLTLSYKVPINNIYIQGMTIWCAANNLWTSTKYLGSDPENALGSSVLVQGIDRGLLPQSKSVAFGLKINI